MAKRRREIPMTKKVRKILSSLSSILFTDLTASQVTHKFTACAKRLESSGTTLHSLRYTVGMYLLAKGYDITGTKELLGHKDINTTLVYAWVI